VLETSNQEKPNTGAESAPRTLEGETTPDKKNHRFSIRTKLAAIGTIAGLAAGGFYGVSLSQSGEKPSQATETSQSIEPTPVATVEAFNPHTLDTPLTATPDQLGQSFANIAMAQETANMKTGIITDQRSTEENGILSVEDFADKLARENVEPIFDAQYVPNWRDVPHLKTYFEFSVKGNAGNIQNYINTPEALKYSISVDNVKVVSQDAEQMVLEIKTTQHYAGADYDAANEKALDGMEATVQITYQASGSNWLIADWALIN